MKLTVKELTYTYRGGHTALRNISFAARQGELLSVLGPNGAGKSTLFRCILGGLPDYGGAILLDGRDARTLDQRTLAAHIAYIPQIHRPTFGYSVLDTVLMGLTRQLSPFRSPSAQQEQQALATLEQLGVVHLTYRNFAELSGGEQQLVLIARALCQQADILVMDEPTSSLDYGNQLRVLRCVHDLSRQGYTVVLSTHDPQHALRFSDRVLGNAKKFAKQAKILQFDVDEAEINKNIRVDAAVIGDLKEILKRINAELPQLGHEAWIAHILDYKVKYPLTYQEPGLTGPYLVEEIYRQTDGDAIIVTEVGQHQMWAAQYYKYKNPRTFLSSGGLGTMGYGLGAAIGAQVANPGKQVINIAGDGCFRMNMNEIATAVRQKLPLIEVIVNNHVLGMVRQWQDLFYEKRYSATVLDDGVDYVKLAEAMGATGYRATTREAFNEALKAALAAKTPVVIDCVIGCDDKVWPMVAPGADISTAFTGEDLAVAQS